MKITNCIWEKSNLDKRVAEISFEVNDSIDREMMRDLEKEYEYIVVKLKPCNFTQYKTIQNLGYSFTECQITVKKESLFFVPPPYLLNIYKSITCISVDEDDTLNSLLGSMTEAMFITDRISLDPVFGRGYSLRRYRNWIYQEFCRGSSIFKIVYQEKEIGFILYRMDEGCMSVLLWGLFEPYQRKGLGAIVPLSAYWLVDQLRNISSIETKISSNNKGIISKLCQLGFNFTDFEYVFVKHN